MATLDYRTTCELNRPVTIKHLDGMFFSQDVKANRIVVNVVRGGVIESLSGSVSANIIRADGSTVVQTGSISGNVASVVMPSSAYAVPGAIAVFVKHTASGVTSTIAAVTGYVYKSTTDTIVDPGTVVPNINELLAKIADCDAATAACIAATAAAPVIDDTAGAGATNKVWSAQKTNTEVSQLKNKITDSFESISEPTYNLFDYLRIKNEWVTSTGGINQNNSYANTEMIPCTPGKTYYLGYFDERNVSAKQISFWKSDGTFLTRENNQTGSDHVIHATAPENSAFLRAGIYIQNTTVDDDVLKDYKVQLTENEEKPYIMPSTAVDIIARSEGNSFKETVEKTFEKIIGKSPIVNTSAEWMQGNISTTTSGNRVHLTTNSDTRITSKTIAVNVGEKYQFVCPNGSKYRVLFIDTSNDMSSAYVTAIDSGYDDGTTWHTDSRMLTVPDGALGMAISAAYTNDATIAPSDAPIISVYFNSIERRVENVETAINATQFYGKKISIIGDSISTFAGADAQSAGDGHTIADGTYTYAGNHCRYPNSYLSNVNGTYWMKLINALGMVLGVNDSWAGSRVTWNGSEGSDYGANIYIASPTRIGHLDDNGTPDFILVNAGTNDIGHSVTIGTFNTESPVNYTDTQIAELPVAQFADAYRALLIRLQKAYPLARIVVMLPNYTTSYYNPGEADNYLEVIKEECDYFGVPWIDMRTTGITMFNTSTYLADGIHPNVSGMDMLYQRVLKGFEFEV